MFLRNHWFGLMVSILVGLYFVVFLLVVFAPKQDANQRGFVKCSVQLAENLQNCQAAKWCMCKEVLRNGWCNVEIVAEGLSLWIKGRQSTPWANYFFQPVSDEPQMSAEAMEYYKQHQSELEKSLKKLKKLNAELENKVKKDEKR